jgi:hypothetical protein
MRTSLITFVACATLLAAAVTALDPSCVAPNNTIPVWTADPVFIRSVPNGKLYQAGTGNDTFNVLHVYGTPYQQGYAQGQLLSSIIKNLTADLVAFIEQEAEQAASWLPVWLIDAVVANGAPFLLELTFNATKPFAPQRYLEEMQGLADGAGVDVKDVQNYNMFPEMTKAACTIVGATGSATSNGKISHLRGLDFTPTCPIASFPQVTIYHDSTPGPVLANVGWTGMIGVLTGLSNTSIGIGEKVWDNHPKDIEGTHGEPWMFILRDALASANMTQALSRIKDANRTCAIHVGVGDSTTNTFNGLTIAAKAYDVYNWQSLNWTGHPIIQDVFYWDKHAQPSHDPCLAEYLQEYWGSIDAETLALKVAAPFGTGDMHCVTFDYAAGIAFIANARKPSVTAGTLPAYNRQFTRLDLSALWNLAQ